MSRPLLRLPTASTASYLKTSVLRLGTGSRKAPASCRVVRGPSEVHHGSCDCGAQFVSPS
jgi:hypothetical protein